MRLPGCDTTGAPDARAPRLHARFLRRSHTPLRHAPAPMSPGPKQIAGIPAALSSAASVHAVMPWTRTSSSESRRAPRSACNDRRVDRHITRFLREGHARHRRGNSDAVARAGSLARRLELVPHQSAGDSPGIVRRSIRIVHLSGYVDIPMPPEIIDACTDGRPSSAWRRFGSSSASSRSNSASNSPA